MQKFTFLRPRSGLWAVLSILIFTGSVGFFTGCNEDENYPQIPYVYVNIFIDPNSTMYSELNIVGGWVYLTAEQPSRGIIVYRYSMDEFRAYERICPYDPNHSDSRVEVESSDVTAIDSVCGSRFLLTDGQPFKGPATLPLKQYQTYYDGNTLHIYN